MNEYDVMDTVINGNYNSDVFRDGKSVFICL